MTTNRRMTTRLIFLTVVCIGLIGAAVIAASGPPPSASGTGQNDDEGILLTFSAAEHTRPGDLTPSYTGIAKERDLFTGTTITIDIDCLQVVDNLAIMSGPVLRAPEGIPVGIDMVFVVQDNGEGNSASPDLFSRFQPLAKGECNQVKLAFPGIENQRGNIQVRGQTGSTCPIGYHQCCPGDSCTPIGLDCPPCPK